MHINEGSTESNMKDGIGIFGDKTDSLLISNSITPKRHTYNHSSNTQSISLALKGSKYFHAAKNTKLVEITDNDSTY
jgi:hypothetical protein